MHYLRGKADWMLRGLPCEPAAPTREKLRALPYFINNLAPSIRANWIRLSRRPAVAQSMKDDLPRAQPSDPVTTLGVRTDVVGVVLNPDGILLGAIEPDVSASHAIEAMN